MSFHPEHRSMLVSGSEDGLIAVFDTAPGLGEAFFLRAGALAGAGGLPLAPTLVLQAPGRGPGPGAGQWAGGGAACQAQHPGEA